MARFHRHKEAGAGGANHTVHREFGGNFCFFLGDLFHPRPQPEGLIGRSRAQKLNRVIGGDRARRRGLAVFFHDVVTGGPVRVAIEQRPNDAAI